MNLFNLIRYQLSEPPTEDELRRLPVKLYLAWGKRHGWNLLKAPGPKETKELLNKSYQVVAHAYTQFSNSSGCQHPDIVELQKMANEYEPV